MYKQGKSNKEPMKLIVIKSDNNIFISDNITGDSCYRYSSLGNLLFDGVKPEKTYKSDWFKLSKIPDKIERIISPRRINERYELKPEFPVTDSTPKVVSREIWDDEDSNFESFCGLYEYKYELTEETIEQLEFSIVILDELTGFEPKEPAFKLRTDLLDRLNYHPVLHTTRPCKLTAQQSYDIIREHVKSNIDGQYARVTSDYDFCLAVKKQIKLTKDEPYNVDVNYNPFGRKRKPKYETRYRKYREIEIFKIAPKSYQDYTVVKPFEGKNYDDLLKNIDEYLDSLMKEINKPLVECPHCNGVGVMLDA